MTQETDNWEQDTRPAASETSAENSIPNPNVKSDNEQSSFVNSDIHQSSIEFLQRPADIHPMENKRFEGRLLGHHKSLELLDGDPTAYGNGYDDE